MLQKLRRSGHQDNYCLRKARCWPVWGSWPTGGPCWRTPWPVGRWGHTRRSTADEWCPHPAPERTFPLKGRVGRARQEQERAGEGMRRWGKVSKYSKQVLWRWVIFTPIWNKRGAIVGNQAFFCVCNHKALESQHPFGEHNSDKLLITLVTIIILHASETLGMCEMKI